MKSKYFKKTIIFFLLFINLFTCNIIPAYSEEKIDLNTEKVIYLTFDDGPAGKITNSVLDILKENDVHATFFLIGEQIKGQEDIVKRMYNEGHSLGLHSMTHKKNHLYCSNEQFLKEMLDTQELIASIVPVKSNILRFPFGCNNNSYKITKDMVELLHDNNLRIYDWNADSGDGANPNSSPSKLLKKCTV